MHTAAHVTRSRRVRTLSGLGLLAVVAVLAVLAAGGPDTVMVGPPKDSEPNTLFAGVPQHGLTLGRPGAPATLEAFVDPQCPYCKKFALEGLPTVVRDYVRTGRIKLVLRPVSTLGPDSVMASRMVAATAAQDLAFPYLDLIYANQQAVNSGYVTRGFLARVGKGVRGLDVAAALRAARTDPAVGRELAAARSRAQRLGVDDTPKLLLTVGGGRPHAIPLHGAHYGVAVSRALDRALAV
jgi:protein-disulfide isomerase